MDYQQTLDWLFQQLASFQRVGQSAYNEDLGNINAICSLLNHPHHQNQNYLYSYLLNQDFLYLKLRYNVSRSNHLCPKTMDLVQN